MRKFLCLVFITFSLFSSSKAQTDSINPVNLLDRPKHALKWKTLNLLNRFPTIQLGYETNLWNNLNLEFNAGYVMDFSEDEYENDFQDKTGVKTGIQLRQYISTRRVNTFFIAFGIDYNYIKYKRSRTFGFDCANDFTCAYFQFDTYEVKRQDRRVNSRFGILTNLGSNFYLEMAFGFAVNSRKYRTLDKISGFDIQYGDNTRKEDGKNLFFVPLVAADLVYRLK